MAPTRRASCRRRQAAELARQKAAFGASGLQGEIETETVQEFLSQKQQLQQQIQNQQAQLEDLKKQRREQKRNIPVSELRLGKDKETRKPLSSGRNSRSKR